MRLVMVLLAVLVLATGCAMEGESDRRQRQMQEKLTLEATAQTGMPAIVNFRERKLLKEILELRDQDGLTTYTYLWNEFNGRLVYLGETIGYGIPYATQYTNPQKRMLGSEGGVIPQADPNGLFPPASAEGTWVLLKNPGGSDVKPVYVEPRIVVSPFPLSAR